MNNQDRPSLLADTGEEAQRRRRVVFRLQAEPARFFSRADRRLNRLPGINQLLKT
jgi:hypothetical protein